MISLRLKNKLQILRFHAVVKETVIAVFLKFCRKHMHKETSDKFLVAEGEHTERAPGFLPWALKVACVSVTEMNM